jgi:mRNA interferase RelE/StbE
MILVFKGSFRRDVSKINDHKVRVAILSAIENVKTAPGLSSINRMVKLRKYSVHYRIELEGNYRIGIIIRGDKVWFSRVLHRSKIYKEFP